MNDSRTRAINVVVGRGFAIALPCPKCMHVRCGDDCGCPECSASAPIQPRYRVRVHCRRGTWVARIIRGGIEVAIGVASDERRAIRDARSEARAYRRDRAERRAFQIRTFGYAP